MKRELELFFTALMFFTRLPVPEINYSQEKLNASSRYFPLVGILVGTLTAIAFMFSSIVFPFKIAILLSMTASILITGAFHEDGFADTCDGFGGGYTKEKILEIMQDSRIGTFGTIGLVLILGTKFILLSEIPAMIVPIAIVSGHAISRLISISLLYSMVYVKAEGKAKPLSTALPLGSLIVASLFGLLPLLLFKKFFIFLVILPLLLTRSFLSYYFRKHIGGYTGDCLGAAQQVSEIIFYITVYLFAQWKFI
ncbi:MAG TPA: adenosylcobinamide-GDP ribazoletransferase [Leptospiraceae bacterium]|nr:adenosylcobinamide-GDP ribazoletransferase [Leptospiraceae bacterium]HMW07832.1 adenosylcobinamide-GDP ribazoletransferase [Leptospiraceae bacterium]HMX34820.1 adenosylcobinamide-GDP ribazoletransferase [Leptospiraceae bacterium]HMY33482.1 adenosylcobinamide-GDP ribazoletransferase [Leptospiraceae bacterium]HMZ65650.1 adenosylcobinamide-GDP ribazoletransferase [Leptospiraceae bacterium]